MNPNNVASEYTPLTPEGKAAAKALEIDGEDDAYAIIRGCHDFIDRLYAFEALSIALSPTSRLGRVDAMHPPHYASHHATRAISGASDHLLSIRHLLGTAGAQTIYGPFTLLRGVFEAVAQGLFILGARNRKEMSFRTLQLECSDDHNARQFGKRLRSSTWENGRTESIKASAAKAGHSWKDVQKPLRYSDIIKEAGCAFNFEDNLAVYWMLTSGIAHHKPWAVVVLTDRTELEGTRNDTGASFHIASNTEHIASMLRLACYSVDLLVNVYAHKAQGVTYRHDLAFGRSIHNVDEFINKYRRN